MTKPHYTIGNKFARLTILGVEPRFRVFCRCECGTFISVVAADLRSGHTQSCGCLQRERAARSNTLHKTTHGKRETPEYEAWRAMHRRCYDASNASFSEYGGRGISVCAEWGQFGRFYADLGPRAPGLSLDRKDNSGNYTPDNCRWATSITQQNNKRNNVLVAFQDKTQTVAMWARELGMSRRAIYARLQYGWSAERTLTEPVRTSS